jgi:hypothetical protein
MRTSFESALLGAMMFVLPPALLSAPAVSDTERSAVSVAFPGFEIEEESRGDLDADGIFEVALLLDGLKKDNTKVLIVLRPSANGMASILAATKPFLNCQHGTEFSLHRRSLRIACFHSSSTMHSSFEMKYALRDGRLQLIGEENSTESLPGAAGDPNRPDTYTSTNYLTGTVITTKKHNGRTVSRTSGRLSDAERRPRYLEDYGD